MDAIHTDAAPGARPGLAELVQAAADEEADAALTAADVDDEFDAVRMSAVVAAQAAGRAALMPADSSGADTVGDESGDLLRFVPDRRTADRLALAISDWAARQGPAVIEFLYMANARFGQLPTPEAQVNAIESLHACQHVLSLTEPPSRNRYRAWFERQSAEMDWASPSNIETACGNWAQARAAAAGEPLVPIAAARAGRLGGYPSDEALLELLRQWHASEPDERRRFRLFRAWVLSCLEGSGTRELAARVISKQTYAKHFGSWAASVANAGLLEDITFHAFRRLVGTPRKYPVEVLEAALHEWAAWDRSMRKGLTGASLRAWREVVLRDRWERRIPEGVPGEGALASQWGTFLDALVAVGLITADEALRRRLERGDRLPPEEVAGMLRAACRECGGVLDERRYEGFRKRKSVELGRSVPSALTVIDKLGARTFDEAVELAERMASDAADDETDEREEEL